MVFYGSLSFGGRRMTTEDLLTQLGMNSQSLIGFNLPATLAGEPELTSRGVQKLLGYVAEGALKIVVGGSYPLAEAATAHRAMEA